MHRFGRTENQAVSDAIGSLSHVELDQLSNELAFRIQKMTGSKNDTVAVLLPPCKEFALAGIACFKSRCTYMPIDDSYPEVRISEMIRHSSAGILVTNAELYHKKVIDFPKNKVIFTEDLTISGASVPAYSLPLPGDTDYPAAILYTSGTTGRPKGVVYRWNALYSLIRQFSNGSFPDPFNEKTVLAQMAGFSFIASVFFTFGPLFEGGCVHIVQREIKTDLEKLYRYIRERNVTHIYLSPEMGITMLERYDFSNIVVFLAGDRVRNFQMKSETAVYNLYGSTEGVVVAYARIHGDEEEIPVGRGTPGTSIFLADEAMNEVADGDVGELVYHADFMAAEYLGDESRTREKWVLHNGIRYFRTGDRMRRNPDGEFIFVGRNDDLVKLRGFRIEMGEVESRVLSSSYGSDIHMAVCMVQMVSGLETLCLYYEADSPVDESGLRKELSAVLADYMVPDFFVCMDRFPRNVNGKVERAKLPVPEGAGDTVFYTSIEAMGLAADIYERYQVKIDYRKVLGSHTRKELDDIVTDAVKLSGKIEKQFKRKTDKKIEEAPLSFAQIGVYADCMANPSSTSYNLPMLIEIPDDKSTEDVKRALEDIIKMHPCLNVRFYAGKNGMVIQKKGNGTEGKNLCSVRTISVDDACSLEKLIRPFSLNGEDPLYRMEILLCSDGKRILFTDFHHLIFDGSSYRLFLRDLNRRLNGFEIPGEGVDLIEYAYRQNELRGSEHWNDTHEFWRGRMAVIDEMTSIMPDLYETKDNTGEEHRVSMQISAKPLLNYCAANNIRSSAVYLAAALYTIAGFTAEETIGIATVSGSRQRMELSNTYGMFVNTLPVTAKIPEGRVYDYIVEISELLGEMIEHDAYPFSELASEYHITPNIMFACQESLFKGEETEGENLKYRQIEEGIAKFPVFIEVLREGDLAEIKVRYDSLKYSSRLMERFLKCYLHVISEMLFKEVLHDITFMTKKQMEKQDEYLRNDPDFPEESSSETVLSLLQNSFINYGNNTAVVYEDREITYRELEERSKAAAGMIIKKLAAVNQKCSEPVAAVMVPRNEYMVIAPIAALRAGCAYQPIDPGYPSERITYMLKDSGAKVLITTKAFEDRVSGFFGEVVYIEDTGRDEEHFDVFPESVTPAMLFTLLYTSGSTGKPKGVMLEHGNLVSFIRWYLRYYDVDEKSRVAAYASFGFDASMMDVYPVLSAGGSVCIVPEDKRLDFDWLENWFNKNRITHSFMTTQIGARFAKKANLQWLRHLSVGGEKLESMDPPRGFALYNAYGPTECTIFSTIYHVVENEYNIPIGRPLWGVGCLITDKEGRRLPTGAMGELIITGPHVGRGYLNLPDKTRESFFEVNGERAYHSGDIVRLRDDGNIEYIARKDGQIKIRGFRIELGEVENIIRQFEGISDVTVCAFDNQEGGGKFLAAYIVPGNNIDIEALRKFILDHKPAYMLPQFITTIDHIPYNMNQKVNRKALPVPKIEKRDCVAPKNEVQRKIVNAISKVLGIDEDISITDSFTSLGGDSIKAIMLMSELREENITLGFKTILQGDSIETMADEAEENAEKVQITQERFTGYIEDTPIISYFKRLRLKNPGWFDQAFLFDCREKVDITVLKKVIQAVVDHHDLLRARFKDGKLYVPDSCPVIISEYTEINIPDITADIAGNLPYPDGELFRFALIHRKEADFLYILMHHTIVDGISWRILTEDLNRGYEQCMKGKTIHLPDRTHSYRYYSERINEYGKSQAALSQKKYWDRMREKIKDHTCSFPDRKMQVVKTAIDAGKAEKLMGLNALFDADHNDVLLSVILYAYHYFTKEREISVLLEGHGRNEFDAELRIERTIGWFTCMYPVVFEGLNSDPDDMFFRTRDTLHRIPENGLAYQVLYDVESQKLPVITFNYLGEMSEKSKNTMFALNFREDTAPMIDPENEYGTDLTVNGLSLEGELIFEIGYNRKRFSEKQMEEFLFAVRDGIQRLTDVLSKRTGFDKSPADYGIDIPFDEFSLVRKEYHDKKMCIEGIEEITGEQYRNIIRQIMGIDLSVGTKSAVIEIEGNVSPEVMKSSIEEIYAKRKELRTIVLAANSGKMYAVTTDLKPDIKYCSVKPHDQREALKELMAIRHDFERVSYRISEDSPARFLFITTDTGFTYISVSINPVLEPYYVYSGILQELLFLMDEKTGGKTNLGEWAEMIKEIAEIRMEKNHEKDDVLAVERKIERILNGIFDGTDNSGEEEKIEDIFTATLLSHKLYDRFRRSVLPIEIMRASGLRGIVELLREKKDRKPKDLYVFQNDKGLKKIILVHTMNMGSEAYVPLAGKLKGSISLAAFEQYNLIHPYHKIHGIRNIASKYIELLKEFQPEGPYTLGGWCYGGLIAYEMALQLKERGETVEEVILFDTHIIDDPVIKEELLTRSKEHVRNYLMNDPLFEDARRKGIIEQLIQNDNYAMSEWISYDPAPYDGKVLYFKALQRADNLKDYQNNMYDYIFSEYAAGFERRVPKEKLTVVPVPTDHDSMMNEDALKVIVPYLRGDNE